MPGDSLTDGQRSLLKHPAAARERNKLSNGPAVFTAKDLVKIVADSEFLLLFLDEWGNAFKPSGHIRVCPGDLGIVLGPVHASYVWAWGRCKLEQGNKASRRHHRMILIQDVPRAIPVCRLEKVVE